MWIQNHEGTVFDRSVKAPKQTKTSDGKPFHFLPWEKKKLSADDCQLLVGAYPYRFKLIEEPPADAAPKPKPPPPPQEEPNQPERKRPSRKVVLRSIMDKDAGDVENPA